jgi:hypothetical protein
MEESAAEKFVALFFCCEAKAYWASNTKPGQASLQLLV